MEPIAGELLQLITGLGMFLKHSQSDWTSYVTKVRMNLGYINSVVGFQRFLGGASPSVCRCVVCGGVEGGGGIVSLLQS